MNDYPSDTDLAKVKMWKWDDEGGWIGLLEFIQSIWWPDGKYGWHRRDMTYQIVTGGWSGNEELIEAMHSNFMFWSMCWQFSRRGGSYVFRVPVISFPSERNADPS